MIYPKVALIGMGLIASSMALAIRKTDSAEQIIGYSRSETTRARAGELGLADIMVDQPEAAVEDADLVVLCTPVCSFESLVRRIAPQLKRGATLSDVGSVKGHVVRHVAPLVPDGVDFLPAHPIAGTEESGPDAGFADLFTNRWCILTPPQEVNMAALQRLMDFWQKLGTHVEIMDAERHDVVLAVTSHVPHLIAYTMVGVADHLHRVTNSEVIQYSAAGFRDFTRIAASDPVMWRDVFLTNKDATIDILGRFSEELHALQRAVRLNDGVMLEEYFHRTRQIRKGVIEAGQDTKETDFGRHSGVPD
ncbi:MAG: prephenate/arogenate dehydrogenase family protein [Rhodobacteraceae bacterium]|nr:prephenate/arogenate dehydrogenase family protein [Paracoccaceae bacterium]